MRIKEQLTALFTLSRKEWVRTLRIWAQSILPPGITMTLYFVIFGKFVGSHITNMHGFSYMQFIAPGLIIMPVITAAYMHATTSVYMGKFQRSIEEILISPTPNYIIVAGYMLGGMFRAVLISVIVFVVSLFFTRVHIHHIALSIITLLLASMLFAIIGITNGLFANKWDDVSIVPTFILTPLTYLGGVFYSISLLPTFWHDASLCNPIFHIINAFRYSMLGISDANVPAAFIVIVIFILGFFGLNLYLLKRGIGIRS